MRPSFLVVCLLALATSASAQDLPVQVRLDTGTFLYDQDRSLVEMYVSFGASTLPFEARADGQFEAAVPVAFRLRPAAAAAPSGAQRDPVFEEDVTFTYVVEDTTSIREGQVIVEQLRTAVVPGEYELAVTLAMPGVAELGLRSDLTVPSYANDAEPAMSSIELASTIARAAEGDDFVKNGLRVVPNPDAFYGAGAPLVSYYAEVYNPPDEGETYTLLAYLADGERSGPLDGLQRRSARTVRPVDVVAGQLDVSTLQSGIYFLRLVVLNAASESVLEQSKRIFVVNPDVERTDAVVGDLDYEDTIYAVMGEEELELGIRHARVIASQTERQRLDQARDGDLDMQRTALASFWRNRDTDSRPGSNAARDEFYQRLGAVNDQFRESGGRDGFESARGRVYLVYGPPSEIERRPFSPELHPHEVWTYNNVPGEGRALFVFSDRFSSGNYDLIHSDVVGEENNPNWQADLAR